MDGELPDISQDDNITTVVNPSTIRQDEIPNAPNQPWYRLWWVIVLLAISLLMGIAGYYYFARLGLVDSLLNASMILGGMGPVDILPNNSAKIFASFYALYSGMVFLVIVAFLIDSVVN